MISLKFILSKKKNQLSFRFQNTTNSLTYVRILCVSSHIANAQIRQATVSLELEREGVIKQRVEATVPQREYTLQVGEPRPPKDGERARESAQARTSEA